MIVTPVLFINCKLFSIHCILPLTFAPLSSNPEYLVQPPCTRTCKIIDSSIGFSDYSFIFWPSFPEMLFMNVILILEVVLLEFENVWEHWEAVIKDYPTINLDSFLYVKTEHEKNFTRWRLSSLYRMWEA
jgi:hypothetical protein